MVQFRILSGQQAGKVHAVRDFPIQIGRANTAQLRLTDPGVWDQHLEIKLEGDGFFARLHANAIGSINGQRFEEIRLRNGDVLEAGGAKLQFWLDEVKTPDMAWRETATWIALAALTAGQLALIMLLGK
jgi:pSer/pThr/pTyr-binding forkhead associated (FHA) protein